MRTEIPSPAATDSGLPEASANMARAWDTLPLMLFMVIERFKDGATPRIGERFARMGRMLPQGVSYVASWVDPAAPRCFQVMEAARRELLDEWTSRWNDLVEFEIIPVETSAEFWAKKQGE